jgi:hypothetical protein
MSPVATSGTGEMKMAMFVGESPRALSSSAGSVQRFTGQRWCVESRSAVFHAICLAYAGYCLHPIESRHTTRTQGQKGPWKH